MYGVIYARYSSEKQSEQSIDGQVRVTREYCERNGIAIIGMYIDRAISARTDHRPEFLRMIRDSAKRKFDSVIVYKLDRFSRDRYDSATYKAKLKQNGVRVISATENISDNPEGVILESVLEGMAEFYSKELSQKVTRGMHESALKGNSTGGTIPLGYMIGSNKKYEIDPIYAPIVQQAFEMYANGFTIKQIYTKFNESGYHTRRGYRFNANSFKAVFPNRKYIGVYKYDDVEIEGGIPAIVDTETFMRVREKLKKNAKMPARGKALVDYLLTGKLFCGHCGRTMVGESAKRGEKRYHYYACAGKKKFHDCNKQNLTKDEIETIIVNVTCERVLNERFVDKLSDAVISQHETEKRNNSLMLSLEAQTREIQKSIDGLLRAFESGAISDTLVTRLNQLEQQKKDTETRLTQEQRTYPDLTKEHVIFFLSQFLNGEADDPEFRRHVIDLLVNAVYVFDDNDGQRITITYNLSDIEKSEITLTDISDMSSHGSPLEDYPNIFLVGLVFGLTIKLQRV